MGVKSHLEVLKEEHKLTHRLKFMDSVSYITNPKIHQLLYFSTHNVKCIEVDESWD